MPRQMRAETAHLLGHRAAAQHVGQRVRAHQQRQADLRHQRQQPVAPKRCAFRARRRIAAVRQATGVAKAHRHYGDAGFIVEGGAVHLQPSAQTVAGGVVPRDAGRVHPGAGCLADNQQTRGRGGTKDRARTEREMIGADTTGADFGGQRGKRRGPLLPTPSSRKGRGSSVAIFVPPLPLREWVGRRGPVSRPLPNDPPPPQLLHHPLRQHLRRRAQRRQPHLWLQWLLITG